MADNDGAAAERPSVTRSLIMTVAIILFVAAFIGLSVVLHVKAVFAGFLFMLYWGGIKHSALDEFVPALVGSLGGTALAWSFHILPQFGPGGLAAVLGLSALGIFAVVNGTVPVLVNMAFMLMLTVGTIPAVAEKPDYLGMMLSILMGAAILGGLTFAATSAARRKVVAS